MWIGCVRRKRPEGYGVAKEAPSRLPLAIRYEPGPLRGLERRYVLERREYDHSARTELQRTLCKPRLRVCHNAFPSIRGDCVRTFEERFIRTELGESTAKVTLNGLVFSGGHEPLNVAGLLVLCYCHVTGRHAGIPQIPSARSIPGLVDGYPSLLP